MNSEFDINTADRLQYRHKYEVLRRTPSANPHDFKQGSLLFKGKSNNGETEDDGSFEFRYPVAAAPVTGVWSSIGLIVLPILSYLLFRM
ncbi:unnamed protein product [Hymenolepis diminuta]|uniref:DUF5808 domain-containing protein n=1 Tax=Hymenolepis diminuta TaxID=6216 RepID=A0A0R3S8H7_HYMDI|nr:unnamed protein product [Hymenolepis diminuta]